MICVRMTQFLSERYVFGSLDAQDLNYQTWAYKKWEAYGQVGWGSCLVIRRDPGGPQENSFCPQATALCFVRSHPG
jgi:hypothetical protein